VNRIALTRGVALAAAAVLGLATLLVPSVATAAGTTTITFTDTAPIEVPFGDAWLVTLEVDAVYPDGPTLHLGPQDGTVDVYLSGVAGVFAAGLAIQPDGKVYVSQPSAAALLPAGTYDVSAIYNPAPGWYYGSSQTPAPLTLTVTPLDATPSVEVGTDLGVSSFPVITASLSGTYIDEHHGAPAGTWAFTVNDADGKTVYETEVAQPNGGTDPIRVEITSKLAKGGQYVVTSTFAPVEELAGGVVVAPIQDSVFQTPSGGFGDVIGAGVPLPIWLAILLLLVLLGLAAAAIAVGVTLSKRANAPLSVAVPAGPAEPQRMPGDPLNVEVVSLEDFGLPQPATIPELVPEGLETKKLPTSTTWLLSDVEPATNLPDAAEAPTERIDAVSAADVKTELIDTGATETDPEPEATDGAPRPS
jgi:hypothetical protein